MGGATAPVSSSGSAPAWTARVSKERSASSVLSGIAAIMASARSACGGPVVELEDQLLPIDVVDLDADLAEAELRREPQRRHVVRSDGGSESGHPVLRGGPVKERPDHLGSDALAPLRLLDAVADLDPPRVAGRAVEAARADDAARPVGLGAHDRPAQPRLGGWVDREVGDAELQEVIELHG